MSSNADGKVLQAQRPRHSVKKISRNFIAKNPFPQTRNNQCTQLNFMTVHKLCTYQLVAILSLLFQTALLLLKKGEERGLGRGTGRKSTKPLQHFSEK